MHMDYGSIVVRIEDRSPFRCGVSVVGINAVIDGSTESGRTTRGQREERISYSASTGQKGGPKEKDTAEKRGENLRALSFVALNPPKSNMPRIEYTESNGRSAFVCLFLLAWSGMVAVEFFLWIATAASCFMIRALRRLRQ